MPPQEHWDELFWAVVWILPLILAGVIVIVVLKRRSRQAPPPTTNEAFTVENLRQLYQQGQLTQAEFERAKANIFLKIRELPGGPSPKGPDGKTQS
jgi:uncharacterized membrane protein